MWKKERTRIVIKKPNLHKVGSMEIGYFLLFDKKLSLVMLDEYSGGLSEERK
jgi:hypothetical protein